MEIVGLHINKLENNPNNRHLDYMAALNSTWHTMLDPEQGQVGEVKGRNPGTKVLARPYVRDQDYHHRYLTGNPQEAGQWAAQVCLAQRGRNPQADAWIVLNEPPCDTTDQLARLAQADIAFMKALEAQGAKGGIGAFSTGNIQLPSIDGGAAVRAYEPAFRYAAQKGHYLVIHCYAAARPMMGGVTPSGWVHNPRYYGLRWHEEIFPYMRSKGIPIPKAIVSEFGLDLGFAKKDGGYTGQYVGYRVAEPWGYGESEAGARQYVDDLIPFAAELAKDSEVQGLCVYCAGDNGDDRWKSFMVDWVLPYLASKAFPSPTTTTTPPPPDPTPPPLPPQEEISVNLAVPYVSQRGEGANESANDCGAAAVKSTVLINTAAAPPVDLLAREAAGIEGQPYPNYSGLQMTTLIELGRRYGSQFTRYKPTSWAAAESRVRDSLKAKKPIIALVHYDNLPVANRLIKENGKVKGHYIVLMGATETEIIYHDPYHDGTKGKGLKMSWATLRAAWEANPQDNNPKYDMLVMQNPKWDAPPVPVPSWTQRDAAAASWFSEQMARALRGDAGAMDALIGAIQAEPKRQGLHDVIAQIALPPLYRERDKGAA